jgi:hypothetical protein
MNNIINRLANLTAYVLHPMLMPTYVLFFLLNSSLFFVIPIPANLTKYIYGLIICFTILLPLSFSLYLKRNGHISSLKMEKAEDRTLPFLFTITCYGGAYYVLSRTSITLLLTIILLGAMISLLLLLLTTRVTKASAHCVGIGGFLGSVICIQYFLHINLTSILVISILLCGIVGTARLIVNAHSRSQVYLGYAIGILGQLIVFTSYKYLLLSH